MWVKDELIRIKFDLKWIVGEIRIIKYLNC